MIQDVVLAAFSVQDKLAHGDDLVPLLEEIFQDGGEGLRGVEGGVVKKSDAARLYFFGDPPGDLVGLQILPVQTVTAGNKGKACDTRV